MGCNTSKTEENSSLSPKNAKIAPKSQVRNEILSIVTLPKNDENSYSQIYDYLTHDVSTISAPPGLIPVLCLAENTIPILVSNLRMDEETKTNIQLPIVAVSYAARGRVVCFSHADMISNKYTENKDFSIFLGNICKWLCGKELFMLSTLLLDIPKNLTSALQSILLPLGLKADRGTFKSDFSNYPIVFIASNIDFTSNPKNMPKMHKYLSKGGSVFCFYTPRNDEVFGISEEPVNEFIRPYGLSYTLCALSPETAPSEKIDVAPKYEFVKNVRFPAVVHMLGSLNSQLTTNTEHLDDIVTALRYYVMVSGHEEEELISQIYEYAFEYLRETGYRNKDSVCPSTSHNIIAILLEDVAAKLPISKINVHPDIDLFPGLNEDIDHELGNHEAKVILRSERLISTGYWVPAGKVVTIECNQRPENVCLQIGIHNTPLLTKAGPWRRWPSIINTFNIEKSETQIASAFGGMLFVASTELIEGVIGQTMTMVCKNVAPYAQFTFDDPGLYDRTKGSVVPWGEIASKFAIFTLKKEDLEQIPDISKALEFIDTLIKNVCEFMSYEILRPYRIVFDIDEVSEDCGDWYPITILIDDFGGIFLSQDSPNGELFDLMMKIAIVSIREGYFDQQVEIAIATLVASHAFCMVYEGFDPETANFVKSPPIFSEIWKIHTQVNPNLVSELLKNAQNPTSENMDVPEDKWVGFLYELCRLGNTNFTRMFEKVRPVPLNLTTSVSSMPLPDFT